MDTTQDLQPEADPQPGRSRTSSIALLAAGSVAGLVLGFSGLAQAADSAPSTGASSVQTATTDEGAAADEGADEPCDRPGGGPGAGAGAEGTAPGTAPDTTTGSGTGGSADEEV